MKNSKKILLISLVLCMTFAFTGCDVQQTLMDILGIEVEEEVDTLTRAAESTKSISLPEGTDATARFETTFAEGEMMYVVFNGIASRDTDYFYAPNGSLTITAKATGESAGMKSFKIALWEKLEGATEYHTDITIYYYTNEEIHSYTITGIDPNTPYRINFSYDAYGYYIYGNMMIEGAVSTLPTPEETPAEDGAE